MPTYLAYIATLLLLLSVAAPAVAEEQEPDLNDLKPLVTGNNTFALDLYAKFKETKGNVFLSPYSISSALAMTYSGARGETAQEMAKVLYFGNDTDQTHSAFAKLNTVFDEIQQKGQVQLHIANSLWPQKDYPLRPEYIRRIQQYYKVSVTPVDYVKATEQARKIINRWVEEKTEDKIKELIRQGALDPMTSLVLVNAIYFKGKWAKQFDPKNTAESAFSLSQDSKIQVPIMYQKGKFDYAEINGAQLLKLPYMGKQLSMVLILPEKVDGLPEIENRLTEENLETWLARLYQRDVNVFLPKFKVTWGTSNLKQPLQALGMQKAFSAGADFSGMDGTKSLFIGPVFHKAFVEVNEEGTEAAAATAVIVMRSMPMIFTFKANHPFLFLIQDNATKSILFMGRVVDPSKE